MRRTVTPDIKQDHTGSQESPTHAPDLANTTREDRADWFDPTQGRTSPRRPTPSRRRPPRDASSAPTPYDDPHAGMQARRRPLRRPHQGRKLGPTPTTTRGSSLEQSDQTIPPRPRSFMPTGAGVLLVALIGAAIAPNSQFTPKRGQHESSTCISVGPHVRRGHRHRRGDRIRAISRRSRRRSRQSSLDEDGVGRRPSVRRLACRK